MISIFYKYNIVTSTVQAWDWTTSTQRKITAWGLSTTLSITMQWRSKECARQFHKLVSFFLWIFPCPKDGWSNSDIGTAHFNLQKGWENPLDKQTLLHIIKNLMLLLAFGCRKDDTQRVHGFVHKMWNGKGTNTCIIF